MDWKLRIIWFGRSHRKIGLTPQSLGEIVELTEKCLFEKFFDDFYKLLRNNNLILNQGVIIDGSFVEIPRQRNTREENKSIKEGRGDELWNEEEIDNEEDKKKKSNKKRHKDTDARWTKKGGQKFYGYKTHTKIDAKNGHVKEVW